MDGIRVARTYCGMCILKCGLNIHVKEGKVVKVEGMKEHVFRIPCIKIRGIMDWVYSEDRLKSPLRRANRGWQSITWAEALSYIADKLEDIQVRYGPKALAVHVSSSLFDTHVDRLARRFCDLYGTPNFGTAESYCYYSRVIGNSLTFNYLGQAAAPNFRGSRCVVLWGWNPADSSPSALSTINRLQKGGAKLIVVDPRVTRLARRADLHAQVRPGTDCALALAVLNVIIEEELYDRAFVEEWTVGFDELVDHVKGYTPQRAQEITGVPADRVVELARTYAESKPATIAQGLGLEQNANGVQAIRAISILIGITGNFDVLGGNKYVDPIGLADLRFRDRVSPEMSIGADYPLFNRFTHQNQDASLYEAILTEKPYPIKGLIIQASNPLLTAPNASKVREAFAELELSVVIDPFMTETAALADIVLPAASWLESELLQDYCTFNFPLIFVADKVIEPLGDSLPDWQIWVKLAAEMGYGQHFPWKDAHELFADLLRPTGVTLQQLRENPGGVFYRSRAEQRYRRGGFNTPSGKMEIYSETLAKYGHDPLPTYEELETKPVGISGVAQEYPFTLITGARRRHLTHSRRYKLANKRALEPFVEVNDCTAGSLGIQDGEAVIVQSLQGEVKLPAKVTADILPGVLCITHGWPEANVNLLTDDMARDPISGNPALRSIPCRIVKA